MLRSFVLLFVPMNSFSCKQTKYSKFHLYASYIFHTYLTAWLN